MTKEIILKQLEQSQKQNERLVLTMVQIAMSPSWDGKQIRAHVKKAISDSINSPFDEGEKIPSVRKKTVLEPA